MSKKNTAKNKEFNVEKALIALENAKPKKQENTVYTFLKDNISIIDKKQNEGMSLKEIYQVINNASALNVSQSTFSKYISLVRKETGSNLYSPRKAKTELPANSERNNYEKCPNCNGNLDKVRLGKEKEKKGFLCNSCNSVFSENGEFLFVNK